MIGKVLGTSSGGKGERGFRRGRVNNVMNDNDVNHR